MSVLAKVRFRELSRSKWQYAAVAFIIVLGIAVFIATQCLYHNLQQSYDASYRQLRFEDFGIRLSGAPERAAQRLLKIPGVLAVEGRLTEEASIEIVGETHKKLVGRLISVPSGRMPTTNSLRITAGRYLQRPGAREILVEYAFAKRHRLEPGREIEVSRGRGRARFKVVGIVQSPEYLYVIRSKQDLFPTEDTFGVMFLAPETLGSVIGKSGSINEVKVRVSEPAKLDSIMVEAKRMLVAYNAQDPIPRKDQPSETFLKQDLQGFQLYSIIFPGLFLTVAALTINTLLTRMVQLQRPMIGLLRALGFSKKAVVFHYLQLALLFGAFASVAGVWLGAVLARVVSRAYMSQLTVPYEVNRLDTFAMAVGIAMGLAFSAVAAWAPARAAARTQPAEALRGAVQGTGRVFRLDQLLGSVPLLWRIPLRNLVRQPRRTSATLLGIVAGIALLVMARGLSDTIDLTLTEIMDSGFKEDLRVEFLQPISRSALTRVQSWPGVVWAEGELNMPAEFRKGDRTYSALLAGVPDVTRLRDFVGLREPIADALQGGVVFGSTLRRRLDLEVGDTIEVSLPKGAVEKDLKFRTVRVAGFTNEPIGTVAYIPAAALRQLFAKDIELPLGAISSVRVKALPEYRSEVRHRLEDLSGAVAATSSEDLKKNIVELMRSFKSFVWILQLFGMSLAFTIVFNTVTVCVLERAQESATMRTLGISRNQVAMMVTVETMGAAVIALFIGLPIGRWFLGAIMSAAQTPEQMDLFVMRTVVTPESYVWAAGLTLISALLSQLPAILFLNHLDLVRVLKERSS